jgi:DivIVA domain-containing protein
MNIAELAAATLPLRRTGSRYDVSEVDDFLAQCVDALKLGERRLRPALRVDEIVLAQFRNVPFFGTGYDADAVDNLLDEVALQLRAYVPESAQEKAQEAELRAMLDNIKKDPRDRRG